MVEIVHRTAFSILRLVVSEHRTAVLESVAVVLEIYQVIWSHFWTSEAADSALSVIAAFPDIHH